MIKKHIFPVLVLIVSLSSCIKDPEANDSPVTAPQGTFTGQFIKEHRNGLTNVRDTVKTNIKLVLSGNRYNVTDVEGVHANSRGLFGFTTAYSTWSDSTANSNGGGNLNSPPFHLNGSYAYAISNTDLKLEAYNDTLKYSYILKKQ